MVGDLDAAMAAVLAAAREADVVTYTAQVEFDREALVMEQLCDALAGTGKTLIFISGSGVFMKSNGGDWSSSTVAEDGPFEPSPFLVGRVKAERIVRAAAEKGIRGIVVRPPVIWGQTTTARWRESIAPLRPLGRPVTSVRGWRFIRMFTTLTSRGCTRW